MKSIDLTVDLLALLRTGFVLLLKILPSGQLIFQAQLVVIGLLVDPVLPGVDTLVADIDNFPNHVGGRLGGRDDAVVHANGQTLADVLAQVDKLPGRRMTVQGLLRRVERGQTQAATRRTGGTELRPDTIDETLTGILASGLELGFHTVDFGRGRRNHRPHRCFHSVGGRGDRGSNVSHHPLDRVFNHNDFGIHNVCHRLHERLHGGTRHGNV